MVHTRQTRSLRALGGLLLLGLATMGAVGPGCGAARPRPATSLVVAAVDRSGSTAEGRARQLGLLDLVASAACADDVPVALWAFDRTPVCVWGPRVPAGRTSLREVEALEMGPAASAAARRGTRPGALLGALAGHPSLRGKAGVHIVVLTDGDSELEGDRADLSAAGRGLAALPGSRLTVLGIVPRNRAWWEAALLPALAGRLELAGPSEASEALAARLP